MSEEPEEPVKEKRNWFMTIFKTVFFVAAFLLVIFTVMANMGGNSDTLKGAIEEFLAGSTGYQVKISTLNHMSFFPTIGIDIEDVQMRPNAEVPDRLISVGSARAAMSFWAVTFSSGKLRVLDIEEFHALAGTLNPQPLYLEHVGILETEDEYESPDGALLRGSGALGDHSISFQINMEKQGREFGFAPERGFDVSVGDFSAQGVLHGNPGRIKLQDLRIAVPEDVITGHLNFSGRGKKKIKAEGKITIGALSAIEPDLVFGGGGEGPIHVSGKLKAETIRVEDIKALLAAHDKLINILALDRSEEEQKAWHDIDLDLVTNNGCLHITSDNIAEIFTGLSQIFPTESQIEQYPCKGPVP